MLRSMNADTEACLPDDRNLLQPARAVTNNPEMLANKLKDRYSLNARTLVWIEH
jgi:hypothetical protein